MAGKKSQTKMTSTNPPKKRGRGRPKSEIPMVRRTFHIPAELVGKIETCAYWDRMTISAVITDALQQYFKGRKLKPIPKDKKKNVGDFY